jgi:prolyl-tRNA synthetase
MRWSQLFGHTWRDDPADADVPSHRLLVRAGYIRRVASGIYAWLPLGRRVLARVERIVREEMDAAGAQEVLLPIVQPLELWQRTGREQAYGPLMFRLTDRREAGYCLAPTAEEVITSLVAGEATSYRDLPRNLYQIGWKYRDELRPRFGLLRAREFLMKDAYSFDADVAGLERSYRAMYDAYRRTFERCGLEVRAVEGSSGEIGGEVNHEFMAVAAVGEDDFVWCRSCDHAANVEVARRGGPPPSATPVVPAAAPPMEEIPTPGAGSITEVAALIGVAPSALLKVLAFEADGELGLAVLPGDRELNEAALARAVAPARVRLLVDEDFAARPDLPRGFLGPHHPAASLVVVDRWVVPGSVWVTGANRDDHHVRNATAGRDFPVDRAADLAAVRAGDPCPVCGGTLSVDRGIEVGQVFQLGTKYSEALGATYTDAEGRSHPMLMGCYGIGISRIVAAVVEQHHDEAGIAWPPALAPFRLQLIALTGAGVREAAERLYERLRRAGVEVLYDDRDARAGVKFADADLVGLPLQVIVGPRGLAAGHLERKHRRSGERDEVPIDDLDAILAS